MRALGLPIALTLTLLAGATASADPGESPTAPSREVVREARQDAADTARDVAVVRAELVLANQRLQEAGVRAAQASEAWNGARYRLQQARRAARSAERHAAVAASDVDRQQDAYADAMVTSYQLGPQLSALGAVVDADGIGSVVDRTTTARAAVDALDTRYDAFRASATLADAAAHQAQQARDEADAAAEEARAARDVAARAAEDAAVEAAAIAAEKDRLIGELARLQRVSKELAARRQAALEAEAQAAAAAAAQEEAAQEQPAQVGQAETERETEQRAPEGQPEPEHEDGDPAPTSHPVPSPPAPAPAPAGGAAAAVAFARAQLGEPYRWGAAGPSAWDCSGLTMGAWREGGTSLPHYSVAQYEQSTPISVGDLRPGDLVFWGSSSSPSSIYHVALYVGDGRVVHAPRTGRPVTEESMYYWTPPNFHARP